MYIWPSVVIYTYPSTITKHTTNEQKLNQLYNQKSRIKRQIIYIQTYNQHILPWKGFRLSGRLGVVEWRLGLVEWLVWKLQVVESSRMIGFTNIIYILIRFYSKNINASHPSQPWILTAPPRVLLLPESTAATAEADAALQAYLQPQ